MKTMHGKFYKLFSIGLVDLWPDGVLKLQGSGDSYNVSPTYDNGDITEVAKVFTGLGFGMTADQPGAGEAQNEFWHSPVENTVFTRGDGDRYYGGKLRVSDEDVRGVSRSDC